MPLTSFFSTARATLRDPDRPYLAPSEATMRRALQR